MRWNLGLLNTLKPRGKFRSLLFLLILIDTVLTPLLLPVIGYASYRDQKKVFRCFRSNTKEVSIVLILFWFFVRGEKFWIKKQKTEKNENGNRYATSQNQDIFNSNKLL